MNEFSAQSSLTHTVWNTCIAPDRDRLSTTVLPLGRKVQLFIIYLADGQKSDQKTV